VLHVLSGRRGRLLVAVVLAVTERVLAGYHTDFDDFAAAELAARQRMRDLVNCDRLEVFGVGLRILTHFTFLLKVANFEEAGCRDTNTLYRCAFVSPTADAVKSSVDPLQRSVGTGVVRAIPCKA
jgi:hypothetical protein